MTKVQIKRKGHELASSCNQWAEQINNQSLEIWNEKQHGKWRVGSKNRQKRHFDVRAHLCERVGFVAVYVGDTGQTANTDAQLVNF